MRIPQLSRGILANPITGATVRSLLPLGLLRNDFEMPGMKHVAILIETSRAYGRGLLRGIARYNREHGQWSTFFQPQGLGDPAPAWLLSWRGDGILAKNAGTVPGTPLQKSEIITRQSSIHPLRPPRDSGCLKVAKNVGLSPVLHFKNQQSSLDNHQSTPCAPCVSAVA